MSKKMIEKQTKGNPAYTYVESPEKETSYWEKKKVLIQEMFSEIKLNLNLKMHIFTREIDPE